jgi:acetyl-CoA decarbonylase/synthase complex subunit gamma
MRYRIGPGLYAAGKPGAGSPVLVTANYKLSFDLLRRELGSLDAWILVLDTNGINVWCAAGKGTFGTAELVNRIESVGLAQVVEHRTLVLPQLGAPGISAHQVKKRSGFRVVYGPVRARDIPAFLGGGMKATPAMRRVEFPMLDRLILTPMEINPALRKYLWLALAFFVIFGARPQGIFFADSWDGGLPFALLGLVAIISGAFLTPVLLPWIPCRAFAAKGFIAGLICTAAAQAGLGLTFLQRPLLSAAALVLFPALSSYLALQFTGATPVTSVSGVRKELRIALPLLIAGIAVAAVLVVIVKLQQWGVL